MANEPTYEDRDLADRLGSVLLNAKGIAATVAASNAIAAALAAERERTERSRDEHWAKWHEEQAKRSSGLQRMENASWLHLESARAIRALGRGK